MDQINRGLTALFIIVFALAVAFFIFYRLGLFTRFFPNSKISFGGILSGNTATSMTPTPTPTQSPENNPKPTTTPPATITPTVRSGQSAWATPLPTRTPKLTQVPVTSIPNTGSPTILLPLLGSLGGLGVILRKKTRK